MTDGRRLRSARNKEAMLQSGLMLIDRGVWRPSAAQVAETSGLSLRTFFTQFKSLEGYYEALLATYAVSIQTRVQEMTMRKLLVALIVGKTRP